MKGPFSSPRRFNAACYVRDEAIRSPTPDLNHTVDDMEVELMRERLEIMEIDGESHLGLFFPRWADDAQLVQVYPFAGEDESSNVQDLDIYMWLPRSPYVLDHLLSVTDGRVRFQLKDEAAGEITHYMGAFYAQEHLTLWPRGTNYFVNNLLNDRSKDWAENILIMKINEEGGVLNMTEMDVAKSVDILKVFFENVEDEEYKSRVETP